MRTASRSGNRGRRAASSKAAAQSNEIVINAVAGETRVAIVEQGTFTELHIERDSDRSVTGMVVLGKVTRVLPGMQAAFVDIGLEKAAFLYAGDYLDETGRLDVDDDNPRPRRSRGRNGSNRQPPRIDTLLREGQEVVVQVAKDPIGTKGARITSHVSIAGRHLVLTPWSKRVGVSRRIDSDRERRRLREIVSRARTSELGFIIRTAGDSATDADIEADVRYLTSVWDEIQSKKATVRAPAPLYKELSLPIRVIRDFAGQRTKRIVIDDDGIFEQMQNFISRFVADPKPSLEHYQGQLPIYDHFGLEGHIDGNLGRKVWLKSGGYLIVDQSEALTAIDVNTGRFVGKRDLEDTVLKTNLEAVKEVVQQLRFRNIGGLIIIDLIDMETAENRDKVYRALQEALRGDKAKTNILKISELGLVEMTRKRTRENLVQQLCEPCPYCEGRSYVLSCQSVAFKVMREIRKDLPRFCGRQIAVTVNPEVAETLLGAARPALVKLGEDLGREIEIRARPGLHQEQFEVSALDAGPPVVIPLRWLEEKKPEGEGGEAEGAEPSLELLQAPSSAGETSGDAAEGVEEPSETGAEALPVEESPSAAPEVTASAMPEPLVEVDDPAAPVAPALAEEPEPGLEAKAKAPALVVDPEEVAPEEVDSGEESPILPRLQDREEM